MATADTFQQIKNDYEAQKNEDELDNVDDPECDECGNDWGFSGCDYCMRDDICEECEGQGRGDLFSVDGWTSTCRQCVLFVEMRTAIGGRPSWGTYLPKPLILP